MTENSDSRFAGGRALKNGEGRVWDFREVGRLPAPGDNVAMATRRLEAGTRVSYEGSEFEIAHTVLEGHRFAVEPIAEGEDLLSWGLRFGRAIEGHRARRLRVQREDPARPARTLFDLAPTRGRGSRGNLGPGRGTCPRRTEQGRPQTCPKSRTSATPSWNPTSWTRRGFRRRRAGPAPRRAAHLYGLQARALAGASGRATTWS